MSEGMRILTPDEFAERVCLALGVDLKRAAVQRIIIDCQPDEIPTITLTCACTAQAFEQIVGAAQSSAVVLTRKETL